MMEELWTLLVGDDDLTVTDETNTEWDDTTIVTMDTWFAQKGIEVCKTDEPADKSLKKPTWKNRFQRDHPQPRANTRIILAETEDTDKKGSPHKSNTECAVALIPIEGTSSPRRKALEEDMEASVELVLPGGYVKNSSDSIVKSPDRVTPPKDVAPKKYRFMASSAMPPAPIKTASKLKKDKGAAKGALMNMRTHKSVPSMSTKNRSQKKEPMKHKRSNIDRSKSNHPLPPKSFTPLEPTTSTSRGRHPTRYSSPPRRTSLPLKHRRKKADVDMFGMRSVQSKSTRSRKSDSPEVRVRSHGKSKPAPRNSRRISGRRDAPSSQSGAGSRPRRNYADEYQYGARPSPQGRYEDDPPYYHNSRRRASRGRAGSRGRYGYESRNPSSERLSTREEFYRHY